MPSSKPCPSTVKVLKEFYSGWLRDRDYVDNRMREIAESAGIGPRKLERCLNRNKVPINFSFLTLSGDAVNETEIERTCNYKFLLEYLAVFSLGLPTAKEAQAALSSLAKSYAVVSKNITTRELEDWAMTEGNLHRALAAYVLRRTRSNPGTRSGHKHMADLKEVVKTMKAAAEDKDEKEDVAEKEEIGGKERKEETAAEEDDDDVVYVHTHVQPVFVPDSSGEEEDDASKAQQLQLEEEAARPTLRKAAVHIRPTRSQSLTSVEALSSTAGTPRSEAKARPSTKKKEEKEIPHQTPEPPHEEEFLGETDIPRPTANIDEMETQPLEMPMQIMRKPLPRPKQKKKEEEEIPHEVAKEVRKPLPRPKKKEEEEIPHQVAKEDIEARKKDPEDDQDKKKPLFTLPAVDDRLQSQVEAICQDMETQEGGNPEILEAQKKIRDGIREEAWLNSKPNAKAKSKAKAKAKAEAKVKAKAKAKAKSKGKAKAKAATKMPPTEEATEEPAEDAAEDAAEDPAEDPAEDAAEDEAEDEAEDPAEDAAEDDKLSEAVALEEEEMALKEEIRKESSRKKKKKRKALSPAASPKCKRRLNFSDEEDQGDGADAEEPAASPVPSFSGLSPSSRNRARQILLSVRKGRRRQEAEAKKTREEAEVPRQAAKRKTKKGPADDDKKERSTIGKLLDEVHRRPARLASGWTPVLAEKKGKKNRYEKKEDMPKSRLKVEEKKEAILNDLRTLAKIDRSIVIPSPEQLGDGTSYTLKPSAKVREMFNPTATINVLLVGSFLVNGVNKQTLKAVNDFHKLDYEANKQGGVSVTWRKGDQQSLQHQYMIAKKIAGWMQPSWT